jgi:hypothetical protein
VLQTTQNKKPNLTLDRRFWHVFPLKPEQHLDYVGLLSVHLCVVVDVPLFLDENKVTSLGVGEEISKRAVAGAMRSYREGTTYGIMFWLRPRRRLMEEPILINL